MAVLRFSRRRGRLLSGLDHDEPTPIPVEDILAPGVPQNVTATPAVGGGIDVYWDQVRDSDLRAFIVRRRLAGVPGDPLVEIARIEGVGGPPGVGFHDDTPVPGTTYNYRLASVDFAGNISADSNRAQATAGFFGPDTQAPEWPVGAAIAIDDITSSGVQFSWPDAQDNVAVDHYRVRRRDTGQTDDDWVDIGEPDVTTPGWGDGNLVPNESNDYRVTALDIAGNESLPLDITIVAPSDTEAPYWPGDDPFLIAIPIDTTTMHLDWADASDNIGVDRYRVRQDGITIQSALGPSELDVSGLTPGQTYTWGIKAYDLAGNASAEFTIMAMVPPSQPPQRIFYLLDDEPWLAQQYYPSNLHCPLDPRLAEYQPEISHEVGRFFRKHNGESPELPNKLILPSGPEVHALWPDFDETLNPQILSEHVLMVGWHAESGAVRNVIIDGGGDWVTSRDATKAKNKATQQSIHTGSVIRCKTSGRLLTRSNEEQAEFAACWPRKRSHIDFRHCYDVTVRHIEIYGPNVESNNEYGNCSPKPPPHEDDAFGVCNGEIIYPQYHPGRSGGGAYNAVNGRYITPSGGSYTRGPYVGELEEQHGFNFGPNCQRVTVAECEVHHVFGDGFDCFGEFDMTQGHTIRRVNVHHTGRQGAAMTCVKDTLVTDCDFDQIGRGMIDFEPPGAFIVRNTEVSDCRFHAGVLRVFPMGGGRGIAPDGSPSMDDVRLLRNICYGLAFTVDGGYDRDAPSWSVSAQQAYKYARGRITIVGNRSIQRSSVSGALPPITLHKYLGVTILDNYLPFNLCSGNTKCGTFANLTACMAYDKDGNLVDAIDVTGAVPDAALWDADPTYQPNAGLRALRQGSLGARIPDPTAGGGQSAGYGNPCFGTQATDTWWNAHLRTSHAHHMNFIPCANKLYGGEKNPPPPGS